MKKTVMLVLLALLFAISAHAQYRTVTYGPDGIANVPGVTFSNGVFKGTVVGSAIGLTNVLGVVSVKDYGAVGDGITSDSAAVQAAINAGAGKTVLFPPGVYRLTKTLTNIANNTKIQGSGSGRMYETDGYYTRSGTVLSFSGAGTTNGIAFVATYGLNQTNNYCEIVDLTLDGNGLVNTGIYMAGTHALRNTTVTGFLVAGLVLYAKDNSPNPLQMVNSVTVDNCSFIYNPVGDGLLVQGTTSLITPYHFRNCIFRANAKGVNIQSGYLATFESCVFENNLGPGIYIYKPATTTLLDDIMFRDCWIEANGTATSGTNVHSLYMGGELISDNGSPRRITFDNCYWQASGTSSSHFWIKSALYLDFNKCEVHSTSTNTAFQFIAGGYLNTIRAQDSFIGSYLQPTVTQFITSELERITGGQGLPLSLTHGFQAVGVDNMFMADQVSGYGGFMRGWDEYLVGDHLTLGTRTAGVNTDRLDLGPTGNVTIGSLTHPGTLEFPYDINYRPVPSSNSTIIVGSTALQINSKSDTGDYRSIYLNGSSVYAPTVNAPEFIGAGEKIIGAAVSTDTDISGYQANPLNYDAFPGLVKLASGTMLLVYRNGTNHLGYGSIVKRTSTDMGRTWSAMSTVLTDALDLRDPSITLLQNSNLVMSFFKYSPITGGSTGPWITRSSDSGATWGTPSNIGTIVGAVIASAVSSPAVETSSNNLALAWYGNVNVNLSDILVSHSTDGGVTWVTDSGISNGHINTEPNLLYAGGTSLLMMYRDDTATNIYRSFSGDNGITWTAPEAMWFGTASPRLFKAASGNFYCFYRALKPTGAQWNKYDGSMAWRVSANGGNSWGYENGFEWQGLYQVYDYASMCEVAPGVIGVAYALHYVAGPPSKLYFKTIKDSVMRPSAQLNSAKITDGNLILDMSDMRFKDSSGGYEDLISDSGRLLLRPTTTGRNGLIVYDSEQNGWLSIGTPQAGTAFNNEGAIQGKDGVTIYDHVSQSYPSLRLKGGTIEIRADTVMSTNDFTAQKVASLGGLSVGVEKGNWKTLVESNSVYFVDTTGANVVLPSPAATSGKIVVVKLVSPATSATVSAPLFSFIDGAASYALTSPDSFVILVCDGVNDWKIIARSKEVNSAVSVKDYGAKGDYTTDDTLSISNAIYFNRNVYFPSGTYKVSMYGATEATGQFRLWSNHRIEMAQDAKIVVSYIPDTFDNGMAVFANEPSNLPVTNVNLINLNIETTNTITGNRGCGILLYVPDTGGVISNKVQNVNIDNCTFKALGSAIYILQSGQNGGMTRQIKGVNITRCKSYDCWGSFVTMDGENITVSDCYANGSTDPAFINSAYDAISCHSGKGNKIVNNVFENWGNQGAIVNIRNNVNSMCGSHEITVTGNTIRSGNRTAISVTLEGVSLTYPEGEKNYGVTGVVIADNTIEGVVSAIYVDPGSSDSTTPFDKLIITGNTIKTPQSGIVINGLAAHNLYNSTISHNAIKVTVNPPAYTAFFVSYLSFTSIADNNVTGYTDDSAFRAIDMGHLNYCSVTGNKVIAANVSAGYYGVYLHTMVSSTVSGNSWYTGADVTGVDALSAYTDNYSESFTKLDGKSLLKGGAFGFNKGRFYSTDNTDPNTKVSNAYNVGDIQYLTTPQISGANAYVCTVAGSPGTHRMIGAQNTTLIASNAIPLFDGYQMVSSAASQLNTNVAFHRTPRWVTGAAFANLQLKGDVSIANGDDGGAAYVKHIGVQGDDANWSLADIRFTQDADTNLSIAFTTFQYGVSQYVPLRLTHNGRVGILNPSPASALDVTGSATVSGDFLAGSYGSGLVGNYDSTKYRGVYAIGSAYTMAKDGSSLANFYGLAMSYPTVTTPLARAGLSHQFLVVENGAVKSAIGTGMYTDGSVSITGHYKAVTDIASDVGESLTRIRSAYIGSSLNVGVTGADLQKVNIRGPVGSPAVSGTLQNGILRIECDEQYEGLYIGVQSTPTPAPWFQASTRTDLSTTRPMLFNPRGGNVGIGNNSPQTALDVTGTITGSAVKSTGSFQVGVETGGYKSLQSTNTVFLMNVDGANATTPDLALGKMLTVKLIAPANTGTVTPQSGYRIDGSTGAYSLTASNKFVTLVSDGSTNWWIIGSN